MTSAVRRALRDMRDNRFLNGVAILTVALSVLIAGAFSLIWTNVDQWVRASETHIRVLVYLKDGATEAQGREAREQIEGMAGVLKVTFISRAQALERLRDQLRNQASLLEGLAENPLPDSLEVELNSVRVNQVAAVAAKIGSLPAVDSVEYGQQWMDRFAGLLNLFRFAGMVLGGLFFIAAGLMIANTARLVLYSRREEVEIMRLVGATDRFITAPFYLQGLVQGACGCAVGLAVIYGAYAVMSARLTGGLAAGFWQIRFLPPETLAVIAGCSIGIGWIGCFLSMKQFFRN